MPLAVSSCTCALFSVSIQLRYIVHVSVHHTFPYLRADNPENALYVCIVRVGDRDHDVPTLTNPVVLGKTRIRRVM
ncbi:hypothetical protein LX36DRAFT_316801 [Colletotrichum falcatum]|nr:hypothetical protein LX36DRAFT_316801 [Colletotrichum falcatum]